MKLKVGLQTQTSGPEHGSTPSLGEDKKRKALANRQIHPSLEIFPPQRRSKSSPVLSAPGTLYGKYPMNYFMFLNTSAKGQNLVNCSINKRINLVCKKHLKNKKKETAGDTIVI